MEGVSQNKSINTRIPEIDIAKGIGIILVVIGHFFSHIDGFSFLHDIIYSFHMPLFFFISGILFDKSKYTKFSAFFKRRMETLVCPYLLFMLISFLWFAFKSIYRARGIDTAVISGLKEPLLQIFIAQYSGKMSINIPMWFVTCFIVVECLYYFISKIQNQVVSLGIVLILVVLGWVTESEFFPIDMSFLPWNFTSALFSLGFFALGNKLKFFVCNSLIEEKSNYHISVCMAVVAFMFFIPSALNLGYVSIGSRHLGNGVLFYICGISGSFIVLFLSRYIKRLKFLSFLGRNSFYVMATHLLFRDVIDFALSRAQKYINPNIHRFDTYDLSDCVITFIVVMIMMSVFITIYNKFKQTLKGVKNNGRITGNT